MGAHVLIVDDDPAERHRIEDLLKAQGHSVESVEGGEAALARLAHRGGMPVAAMILDLVMPDVDGMAVLERLAGRSLALPVIAQTAPGGIGAGASAMRAGAFDFLEKPASPERIRASLANALRLASLEAEIRRMRLGRAGTLGLDDITGRSPAMERVHRLAARAARSALPLLIEGERGVGKELLARAIHGSGMRRGRSFIALRCDDLKLGEIEAALFGCEADGGLFRQASGGTLFIDEIGALPHRVQARLADLLAANERAAASGRPAGYDIRLMAASSRRLIDLVSAGGFHTALFNRLNVLSIWLPPLRDRRADIPALARSIAARVAAEAGRPGIVGISSVAMGLMLAHDWRGNIRELEHTILRAIMLSAGGELAPEDFPSLSAGKTSSPLASQAVSGVVAHAGVADQEHADHEERSSSATVTDRSGPARYGLARLLDERGEMRPIGNLEEEAIRFAIDHYRGRMSEVARRLGIGRSTLYRKIKDYGIVLGEPVVS